MNNLPTFISAPCERCRPSIYQGWRHKAKLSNGKLVLRCVGCGGGWAMDAGALPANAPMELVLQSINNLIANRIADMLPPHPGEPGEESARPPP